MIVDIITEIASLLLSTDKARKMLERIPHIGAKDKLKAACQEALSEFVREHENFSIEYFKIEPVQKEITKLISFESFDIQILYTEYCKFNKARPSTMESFKDAINDFWKIYLEKASNKLNLPLHEQISKSRFSLVVDSKLDKFKQQILKELYQAIEKKRRTESKPNIESRRQKFITEVSSIIEQMGFEVKTNEYIDDYLVDIYAEQKTGVFTHRLVVKCSTSSSGARKREIMDFCNVVRNVQIPGYFISQEKLSKQARELVGRVRNLELFTYESLLDNLINVNEYIKNLIHDYENYEEYKDGQRKPIIDILDRSNLFKYYIDLDCIDLNGIRHEPMDNFIEKWLKDEQRNYLSILGDFGIGKSSFCLKLTYDLAKKYQKNPINNRIPIFISLKNYSSVLDVRQLITDLFVNTYNIKIANFLIFKKLLDNGKFILIFDGFDEMASRVDKATTIENFRKLEEVAVARSKTILTCRTHYFKTQLEAERLLSGRVDADTEIMKKFRKQKNFEMIFVEELNDDQIKVFIQRHSDKWQDILKTIQTIYNLRDLARRPILLDMIVKTISELKDLETINAADLYRLYTNIWIQHDDWRSLMTPEGKMALMEKLASKMLLEGDKQSINYVDLPAPIREHFKSEIISRQDLDYYDNDTRTCTFLNRDRDGNYKFVHKSFQEYFIAQQLVRELRENKPNLFTKFIYLPVEVYGFVDDMINDFNPYYEVLIDWMKKNYFPAAAFIGVMGFHYMIPELCQVLSDNTSDEKTKYHTARSIERLHNSSFQPYYKLILNWKKYEKTDLYYKLNTIAMRGYNRKTCTPDFYPVMLVKKDYDPHSNEQQAKVNQVLLEAIEKDTQSVRINASYALIRWLQPKQLQDVHTKIEIEVDPHVKGNLVFSIIRLMTEGRLGKEDVALNRLNLSKATLRDIGLNGQELPKVDFQESNLRGANFERANLEETNFYKADLSEVNFHNSNLRRANLECCNLKGANFEGTNLEYANLKNTNLEEIHNFLNLGNLRLAQFSETCSLSDREIEHAKESGAVFLK